MDRRQAEALDRWLTTDPRDTTDVCPECGECEMVPTDCEHEAWQCQVTVVLDGAGDPDVTVCRTEYQHLYHDDEPYDDRMCSCDSEYANRDSFADPYCEVHGQR